MADLTDPHRWGAWLVREWTKPEPAPLEMSDTEVLDWMSEYCDQAVYNRPTEQLTGGFVIYCDEIKASGATLRDAVKLAAAKVKEENQ